MGNEYKNIRQLNGITVADFDLEKAIAGHEVVTRGGLDAVLNKSDDNVYMAYIIENRLYYYNKNKDGKFVDRENDLDLFLKLPDTLPSPSKDDVWLDEIIKLLGSNMSPIEMADIEPETFNKMVQLFAQYAQQESKRAFEAARETKPPIKMFKYNSFSDYKNSNNG